MMKKFSMKHKFLSGIKIEVFTEDTAPEWLKYGGKAGSTMDNRWFWKKHVITLSISESVETDFQIITRIE